MAMFTEDPVCPEVALKEQIWKDAMMEEINAIEKNQIWSLVKATKDKNAISLKWIFKTKLNADGSLNKHKARLVARGFNQEEGIDYEETFSPVARFDTVRLIVALAAQHGWKVHQFDVKSAFLNGDLKEEVYVQQPTGFVVKGKENWVYRLNKALYGLKQAPRAWYSKVDRFFHEKGYQRSPSEATLYWKRNDGGYIIMISLYVDDMIYTGSCMEMIEEFRRDMMTTFEMTDLGELKYFLGLEIRQSQQGIFLCQKRYALEVLKEFELDSCKPADTPMNANEKLKLEDGTKGADARKYRSLVGKLIYLTHTRPDICFAVSLVSRFMHQPTKQHLGAAKRILKYVSGTRNLGIWYDRKEKVKLVAYSDSDWAGDQNDRKSTSGNLFLIGDSPVAWSSKKQETVALSTAEAEYISVTTAACQVVWLRRIMQELGEEQDEATIILCDSKSAAAIAKNPVMHGRTKHIEIKYHFIRDLIQQEVVKVVYCRTEDQLADVFTKSLSIGRFVHLRKMLNITSCESQEGVKSDPTTGEEEDGSRDLELAGGLRKEEEGSAGVSHK